MSTNQPLDKSVRQWGMACHLSAFACIVVGIVIPIPFLGVLIPYIVWQSGRDRHPFIDEQGREAINFQLSMSIYLVSAFILWLFLAFIFYVVIATNYNNLTNILTWVSLAGIALLVLCGVFQSSVILFASVKAFQGQSYRYPFTLRFLQ